MTTWYRPAGTAGAPGFDVALDPAGAGLEHTGLHVTRLAPGESRTIRTRDHEWLVLPLSGHCHVECDGRLLFLHGRTDPFGGPSDSVYVPPGVTVTVSSATGARVALPHAATAERFPFRRIPAEAVPVTRVGSGRATRQVNRIATPEVLRAGSLIATEVLTPAGNWSGYPPHKHDRSLEGRESALEEIGYFELRSQPGAPAPADGAGFGYQHVQGTQARTTRALAAVRSGDVVLIPHGWHGPAMAPPGYDMYALQVMAGPGLHRELLTTEDPQHAWVRSTWEAEDPDPRLPFPTPR